MAEYIDGFVHPIPRKYVEEYKSAAQQISEIWKEHGAMDYKEFIGDEMSLEGTVSFTDILKVKDDEFVVFGWVVFPSKEIRDLSNKTVPEDPRMSKLIEPLVRPDKTIFNARRMLYGGFEALVK